MINIPIAKPLFDEDEMQAVIEPLRTGWVSQGPKVAEFENAFRAYVGVQYASAVNSGTSALHLALIAAGIGPGDEVITTSFTCVATINPIEFVGAKPIFVDIDIETFNIDASKIEENIGIRTKAIIPVGMFGLCVDIDAILNIAEEYKLIVIEDAALALGAFHKGKHAGMLADAACFSFHPRKMITTGEGGMVLTNSDAVAARVAQLRNYGASRPAWERHGKNLSDLPRYEELGYNYKLTDIQAAIGVKQLAKLPAILQMRREIAHRYDKELHDLSWLRLPVEPVGYTHSYQSYVVLVRQEAFTDLDQLKRRRDALMQHLAESGIASVQGAQTIHRIDYYQRKYHCNPKDFSTADLAEMGTIALPIYPGLTCADQDYVIQSLRAFQPRVA